MKRRDRLIEHMKIMKYIADQEKRDNEKNIAALDVLIKEKNEKQSSGKSKKLQPKM